MSRLPSALGRRPDTALHPIHASERRLAAARHAAALVMLGMSGLLVAAMALAALISIGRLL